jgi:cytoplasmic iron level regulating protein YaaA (DUF328/UPF0246 family)
VLILLPPSEGKTSPARGAPVNLDALSHPELSDRRERLLDLVIDASARPDAARVLDIPPTLTAEIEHNTTLRSAPAAPAAKVYTGVLYAAAGLDSLTGTARRRANRSVRIVSGLWGVLAPTDRIPAYRTSICAKLPGIGELTQYWAPALRQTLGEDWGVVIDARSSSYLPAWRPPSGLPWLTVRVVQIRDGKPSVVSHFAKHTRGVLTHHLLTRRGAPPRTAAQVLAAAQELIPTVLRDASLLPRTGRTGPDTLELVLA